MSDIEALLAPGRMKTYRGEDRARITCPAEPLDGTQRAAQAYVDRIVRSAWWGRTCPASPLGDQRGVTARYALAQVPRKVVVIEHHGGGGYAHYSRRKHRGKYVLEIRLGRKTADQDSHYVSGWTQALSDPYVILHELAHLMAACNGGENGHGRIFRYYMVALVKRWLGPEHARALQEGYEAEGLKWRKPRGIRAG